MTPVAPDLRSLRLLVQVGLLGSLGRAAHYQQISQPAASKRIAQLERDLGLPLLRRSASGSTLTCDGQIIAGWATRVTDTVDSLLEAAISLRAGADTSLQVAASVTIAEHLIPTWLSGVQAAHPALHIGMQVANSEQVQELVLHHHTDIGFVEGPRIDPHLTARQVAADRLAVVVSPEHPWARRRRPLRPVDLLRTPLVVREPGSGTRLTLDQILNEPHAEPLLELGSNEAVKGAVLSGAGPAVLSQLAVQAELANGQLIELTVTDLDLTRKLLAIWPHRAQLNEPSRWLLAAATSATATNRAPPPSPLAHR